ncbi:hypothetical protein Ctob_011053 [Chrysochromulina tobinii]|uniref:Uncharacterized protein n=1 Tax=Chrysochromulina tobinii TaxID=1460289 RepID=A0A0M0KAW6_9EUKA|nr:hypothetical protein Ctob_011053 [Chrysochromulina tobinii]|eukprot:KOO35752.1 hypothetical protein Ctob_011053 [Chrysochromulina sp. CCMP291]
MRELPEQECKRIDIRAVLKADERAAKAEAEAAAATAFVVIAALVQPLRQPLGRQITQCTPPYALVSILRVVQAEARQTKVGEFAHRVVRVEQCIIRLDIVVQDAVRVEEAQPARQLHREANLLVVRKHASQVWGWRRLHQLAAGQPLRRDRCRGGHVAARWPWIEEVCGERAASHVLEDERGPPVNQQVAEEGADARVAQATQDGHLLEHDQLFFLLRR